MKAGILVAAVLVAAMLRTDSNDRRCDMIGLPHVVTPGGEMFDASYTTPKQWPELPPAEPEDGLDPAMERQGWVLVEKIYDNAGFIEANCYHRMVGS